MTHRELFALAFAVLAAVSTAAAQAPAPAAQAPAPAASAPPLPAASQPRLEMKAPARREAPVSADARGCLEFPDNVEVIKCAEKYLHRRAG